MMRKSTPQKRSKIAEGAVEVEFSVRVLHAPEKADEVQVFLLGNATELGGWNVDKAVPMEIAQRLENETQCFANVVFATPHVALEYKYIIKHAQTQELLSWEAIPGNRTLTIAKGTNVALDRPAVQSSTYESTRMPAPGARVAKLGNNGNTNGFQEWRCCRTNKQETPWWEVDLGKEFSITHMYLWKALTYHELPVHPEARPPLASAGALAPPTWIFISKDPLPRDENSLVQAKQAAETSPDAVIARQIDISHENRVESLSFVSVSDMAVQEKEAKTKTANDNNDQGTSSPIVGRYVRIQQESISSVLQFAELQVISEDRVDEEDGNGPGDDRYFKLDDGFYGVDNALDSDLRAYVESGWLDPGVDTAEVRLWVGSYNDTVPPIQWLAGEPSHQAVAIDLRYQQLEEPLSADEIAKEHTPKKRRTSGDSTPSGSKWKSMNVQSTSASLLDRESMELLSWLEKHQEKQIDLSIYQNSDTTELPGLTSSAIGLSSPHSVTTRGKMSPKAAASWLSRLGWSRFIKPPQMEKLLEKAETKHFTENETILAYGEQQRTVFFVREGEIDVCGPDSSTGTLILGTFGKDAIFNEMSLFGQWAKKTATFRAKQAVTCEIVTFKMLLDVVGEETIWKIREHYIRVAHAFSISSATSSAHPLEESSTNGKRAHRRGSSIAKRDEDAIVHYVSKTQAQIFRVKVPLSFVSGTVSGSNMLSHRWTLEVYDCAADEKTHKFQKQQHLGSAYLLPTQLGEHGEGNLTLPIFANGSAEHTVRHGIIGQLTLTYLVIKPFVHQKNNLSSVWRSYWRERPPLNIGHRGMGRSYHQVAGYRHALTRENTLASFILAGRSGADFVEFDVQLTKDRVPVLYHDFVLNVGLEDKQLKDKGLKGEEFEIGIHELTLRQLTRSQTTPINRRVDTLIGKVTLQQRLKKHWSQLIPKPAPSSKRTVIAQEEAKRDDGVEILDDEHLVEFYPTLENLLKHVPVEIGLNVEVKYPDNLFRIAMRALPAFAINEYVDVILKCVFDHAGSRRIFFSCFDPNICVLLRAKQATYPVFFLTYGSINSKAFDARLTLQLAVNFVNFENLQGIVSNSDSFIERPELVQVVKEVTGNKVLLTWGDQNTNHDCVQLQKKHAIDGVISDNILDLISKDKKLRSASVQ